MSFEAPIAPIEELSTIDNPRKTNYLRKIDYRQVISTRSTPPDNAAERTSSSWRMALPTPATHSMLTSLKVGERVLQTLVVPKPVLQALRRAQLWFQERFGVKTLSATLLGPAFHTTRVQRVAGRGTPAGWKPKQHGADACMAKCSASGKCDGFVTESAQLLCYCHTPMGQSS